MAGGCESHVSAGLRNSGIRLYWPGLFSPQGPCSEFRNRITAVALLYGTRRREKFGCLWRSSKNPHYFGCNWRERFGLRMAPAGETLSSREDAESPFYPFSRSGEKTGFSGAGLVGCGLPSAGGLYLCSGRHRVPDRERVIPDGGDGDRAVFYKYYVFYSFRYQFKSNGSGGRRGSERTAAAGILMVRESPLHLGHLRSPAALTEMGAVVAPPVPAFYHHPQTIDDLVEHTVRIGYWTC